MAKKSSEASPEPDWCVRPSVDNDGVQSGSGIDIFGYEHPDPQPLEVPMRGVQPGLDLLIREYVRREVSSLASENEFDTFEEADDFDIEDDPLDKLTEYEKVFDPADDVLTRAERESREVSSEKESKDGNTSVDKRRVEHGNDRSGGRNKERKGKSKSEQDADDDRSVPEADSSATRSDE